MLLDMVAYSVRVTWIRSADHILAVEPANMAESNHANGTALLLEGTF